MAVLSNGKILVGGGSNFSLMRLNADGSLDTTFGGGTGKTTSGFGTTYSGYDMAVQSDGKILMVGNNASDLVLARFNADGSKDTAFGTGTIGKINVDFNGSLDKGFAITLQSDGKIVVAGQARNGSTDYNWSIARFTTSGTLDSTFGTGGKVTTDFGATDESAYDVAVQSDGKIVVAGYTNTTGDGYHFALARYNAEGSLDTSFGTGGKTTTDLGYGGDRAYALSILSTGKILLAGRAQSSSSALNFGLAMYTSSGNLDTSFGNSGIVSTDFDGSSDYGEAMAIQPDGDVVVAGASSTIGSNGATDFALARYLLATSQTLVVNVNNVAPTVTIDGSSNPSSPVVGNPLHFTSTVTDPGTADMLATDTYVWTATLGGVVYATGTNATFDFDADDVGSYSVSLDVTDKDGGVGHADATVVVVADIPPITSRGTTLEFQDGNGSSSWDQYSGVSGNRWIGGWRTIGTNATYTSADVVNTSPLNNDTNLNYLSATLQATSGSARGDFAEI